MNLWMIVIPSIVLVMFITGVVVAVLIFQSMVERLHNFLEGKRQVRLRQEDLGVDIKLHRPEHLKKLLTTFRLRMFENEETETELSESDDES